MSRIHVLRPGIRHIEGALYYNCGDWVESCTALVEHHDGRLEILHWTEELARAAEPQSQPVRASAG
jgi:hypothetical protein